MQLLLKSAAGLHIDLKAGDVDSLLNLAALCRVLAISYQGVKQRIHRGDTLEQAIAHFTAKKDKGE